MYNILEHIFVKMQGELIQCSIWMERQLHRITEPIFCTLYFGSTQANIKVHHLVQMIMAR